VALLDLQCQGDGHEVVLAEPTVPPGPPGTSPPGTSPPGTSPPGTSRPSTGLPGTSPFSVGPFSVGPFSAGPVGCPARGPDAAAAAGGRWLADGWQQPEQVAVAEHPR